jgi:hypothetical protein
LHHGRRRGGTAATRAAHIGGTLTRRPAERKGADGVGRRVYAGDMAIARLHGGPLDGQLLPLEDPQLDRLIVPYSETQVVYERKGAPENTGDGDGPTEAEFWFIEAEDDIDPYSDTARERR